MAMIMFCHPERERKVSRNRRENIGSKQLTLEDLALVKVKQLYNLLQAAQIYLNAFFFVMHKYAAVCADVRFN